MDQIKRNLYELLFSCKGDWRNAIYVPCGPCPHPCKVDRSGCLAAIRQDGTPLLVSIRDFEKEAWKEAQLLPSCPETCMSVQFGHIMSGGYAAGYYSYKWAEVLDADAFSLFQQEGIFNRSVAERFRENILSKGGTVPPMELYKRFRGQEPTIDALLRRNGIRKGQ